MRICKKCFNVEGWSGYGKYCYDGSHAPVDAVVVDCPFLERTTTGKVTTRRIQAADSACFEAPDAIKGSHHYGDPNRRHIMTPADAVRFEKALARLNESEPVEPDYEAARDTLAFAIDSDSWENLPASRQVWMERAAKGIVDAALVGLLVTKGEGSQP